MGRMGRAARAGRAGLIEDRRDGVVVPRKVVEGTKVGMFAMVGDEWKERLGAKEVVMAGVN